MIVIVTKRGRGGRYLPRKKKNSRFINFVINFLLRKQERREKCSTYLYIISS